MFYYCVCASDIAYNAATICRTVIERICIYSQISTTKPISCYSEQSAIAVAASYRDAINKVVVSVKLAAEQLGGTIAYGHPRNAVHIQIRSQLKINPCVCGYTTVHHFGNPREVFSGFNQVGVGLCAGTLRPLCCTAVPYVGLGFYIHWQ